MLAWLHACKQMGRTCMVSSGCAVQMDSISGPAAADVWTTTCRTRETGEAQA
jgi:hypothetical protein